MSFYWQCGRWFATPLFIVLLMLETTDLVFAVDSVPAEAHPTFLQPTFIAEGGAHAARARALPCNSETQ